MSIFVKLNFYRHIDRIQFLSNKSKQNTSDKLLNFESILYRGHNEAITRGQFNGKFFFIVI